ENVGFPAGNNRGISHAIKNHEPEFLFLLNNDTIIKDSLEKVLESFMRIYNSKDDIGIISPLILCYPEDN
ncbi:MAG: hypothetical protein ABEI86_01110, partial [Halobacteriaceae archaeon]